MKASPRTVVPSVKILGLKVNFGVLKEVKMLANFLRCFPNVDMLHIEVSGDTLIRSTSPQFSIHIVFSCQSGD